MKTRQVARSIGEICTRYRWKFAHPHHGLTSTAHQPQVYDVVTVGGGPIGLALVAALKSSPVTANLRIALLEAQPLSKVLNWKPKANEYSNRASSLTPSSVSFLEEIQAWKHVEDSRIQPYHEMQVWDASHDAKVQFDWDHTTHNVDSTPQTIATMTENANLVKGLASRVLETEGMYSTDASGKRGSLMFNSTVARIENGEDDPEGFDLSSWPIVSLSAADGASPTTIAARLLIGADGANSPVRKFACISSNGWDYHRHGVVATLNLDPQPGNGTERLFDYEAEKITAYQRFLPACGGPIALLPLPNGTASLVWSTTAPIAAYLKSLPPSTLVTMVNAAFRLTPTDLSYMLTLPPTPAPNSPLKSYTHRDELAWRMQHTPRTPHTPPPVHSVQPNTLASFPLRFRQSSTYISPRVALIGDAAHTIHPLAGQGLNLGLADARALFRIIEDAVLKGQDLGDELTVLSRYNRQRWNKGLVMGGACDAFHRLYGVDSNIAALGRGAGMAVLDRLSGVKGWIMDRAKQA